MPICSPRHSTGSALLSALFIMTLVAIAATAMTLRLQIDIYKTNLTIKSDKPYLASQLVIFWGMTQLMDPKNELNQLNNDGTVARFPGALQHNYPELELSGYILDMQGRFNLNNISKNFGRKQFNRLITKTLPATDDVPVKLITEATWYWQNQYRPGRGQDKMIELFLQQKPPRIPAQMPFASISELRMIPGVNANIWNALAPFITALPKSTGINLNTASPHVLSILGNGLSDSQVSTIISARNQSPITQSAKSAALLRELHLGKDDITLKSEYFMVVGIVRQNGQRFTNYSLFERKTDRRAKGKIKLSLIRESLNTL
ncbi:MAG: type II secretion system minor pseudopilin GspK [Legionellaceae bacterium]|nr:type II secretion system minor pseudopilin GspK [Legionellaceae bacterium]